MSEHITVGELCARHIGRQIILSQDGDMHQIAGQQVLLIGITHMLADQTCTCIAWPFSEPMPTKAEIRAELKGHDLMCWCPVKDPRYGNRVCCHADALLKIANMEVPDEV